MERKFTTLIIVLLVIAVAAVFTGQAKANTLAVGTDSLMFQTRATKVVKVQILYNGYLISNSKSCNKGVCFFNRISRKTAKTLLRNPRKVSAVLYTRTQSLGQFRVKVTKIKSVVL
jgi:hypothetical protein